MKKEIPIIYEEEVKKISFFDILVSDIHAGDEYEIIEGTSKLTYHEVWEWISQGGDWGYKVVEHGNPENLFMSGLALKNMDSARKGKETFSLGAAHEDELEKIKKELRIKYEKELEEIKKRIEK